MSELRVSVARTDHAATDPGTAGLILSSPLWAKWGARRGPAWPPSLPTHQDVGSPWPDVVCESIGERLPTGLSD